MKTKTINGEKYYLACHTNPLQTEEICIGEYGGKSKYIDVIIHNHPIRPARLTDYNVWYEPVKK